MRQVRGCLSSTTFLATDNFDAPKMARRRGLTTVQACKNHLGLADNLDWGLPPTPAHCHVISDDGRQG